MAKKAKRAKKAKVPKKKTSTRNSPKRPTGWELPTSHPPLTADQKQALGKALKKHDLTRLAAPLAQTARPQLQLRAGKVYARKPPVGKCRFGGAPDLPPKTPWPEVDGRPLLFMAQLRLEDLSVPEGWPLPRSGLLSFFKGDDEERFDVEHRVLYSPRAAKLARLDPPELDLDDEHLQACSIKAGIGITVPGYGDETWSAFELEDAETDRYFDLEGALHYAGAGSLLGRDFDVDQRPTVRLAIDRLKGPPYDHAWQKANQARIDEEAAKWVPLFQMSSLMQLGLCMWDAYTFCVLIRWDDLEAGRFDRTHAQLART